MKKAHFLIKCAPGQPPNPAPSQSSPSRSQFVRSHVGSSKNKAWEQRNKRPSCLPAVTFPLRSQVVVVHKASLALHVPSLVH